VRTIASITLRSAAGRSTERASERPSPAPSGEDLQAGRERVAQRRRRVVEDVGEVRPRVDRRLAGQQRPQGRREAEHVGAR